MTRRTAGLYALYAACVGLTVATAYVLTGWPVTAAVVAAGAIYAAIPLRWPERFGPQE
jgi:hypothetical protein